MLSGTEFVVGSDSHSGRVTVKSAAHVVIVGEDECLLRVKADGDLPSGLAVQPCRGGLESRLTMSRALALAYEHTSSTVRFSLNRYFCKGVSDHEPRRRDEVVVLHRP